MRFYIKSKIIIALGLVLVLYKSQSSQLNYTPTALQWGDSLVVNDTTAVIKKFTQTGLASYYANKFHGRRTASGERYSKHKLTAAHRTLPFGAMVKVTEVKTGKWLVVRINDRGPHVRKRVIDLSYAAAKQLGMVKGAGIIKVKIKVVEWP